MIPAVGAHMYDNFSAKEIAHCPIRCLQEMKDVSPS